MKVYRVQASKGQDWTTSWYPYLDAAKQTARELQKLGHEVRLEQIETGSNREDLCYVLNYAAANHMNLEGELVKL